MAQRALVDIVLLSSTTGLPRASKTLTFYEENGSTPLAQSLYAAQSGGSPLVPPYTTNSVGTFRAYAPIAQNAVCVASDDPSSPFPIQFEADQADEILEGDAGHTLADLAITDDLSVGRFLSITGTVTAAEIQAAVDADLAVLLPEGTHTISATITLRAGSVIRGRGTQATILSWTGGNGGTVFSYSAVSFTPSHVTIADLAIKTTNTSVTGISVTNGGFEIFENLIFQGVAQHVLIDRGFGPRLRNIVVATNGSNGVGGSWFGSTDQADYLYDLGIVNFDAYSNANVADATAVLTLNRVSGGTLIRPQLHGVADASKTKYGIQILNDCQGVRILGGGCGGATQGIVIDEDPNYPFASFPARIPTFTDVAHFDIDQPRAFAIVVGHGAQTRINGCAITNGSANAILINADGVNRTDIDNCTFEGFVNNGITIAANGSNISIRGNRFFSIGNTAGCSITIGAGASNNVLIAGNDFSQANFAGPAVNQINDAATSGSNRVYVDNAFAGSEDPTISTAAGVTQISPTVITLGNSGATVNVSGGFAVSAAGGGSAVNGLAITNTSNSAGSDAVALLTVGGTSGGDAKFVLTVPATTAWAFGIDNSDSDAFVFSANASLGTSNALRITTAGAVRATGVVHSNQGTATTANGALALSLGASGPDVYVGSGAPTVSAAKGSLYLRTDGSTTNDRAYIATNSSGTWTAITTVA